MNGLFVEEDFRRMAFNIHPVEAKKDLLKEIPALKRYESFRSYTPKEGEKRDQVIRYVLYLYDMKSPFVSHYSDLQERKETVAVVCGYDLGKDEKRLNQMFMLEDKELLDMILEFMRDQNWMKWSLLVSCEQTFYEYQRVILDQVTNYKTDKDRLGAVQLKSQMMDDCDKIIDRIEKYHQDIFGSKEIIERAVGRTSSPESMVIK